MADIDHLIQDLQSDDLEIKYNACKQLEIEPQLPNKGIEALRLATNDPNSLVAVAAYHALVTHDDDYTNQKIVVDVSQWETDTNPTKPTYLHQFWVEDDPFWGNLFVGVSAITAFFSSFIIFMSSKGYAEASKWVPFALIYLVIISLGTAIIASFVSLVIIRKYLRTKRLALHLLFSLIIGIIIGVFSGLKCNIWR